MNNEQITIVKEGLANYLAIFEKYMEETVSDRSDGVPPELFEAMEYSLCAGGKRLRPTLCLAAAERCGVPVGDALPMALGLEMLHTATLIHDDLPCMDDDDMRRGMLSNHARFGETIAVLAGDALLIEAFAFPAKYLRNIPSQNVVRALQIFADAAGSSGVCGGQVIDMRPEKGRGDPDYVRRVAALKTGELIKAAVLSGAVLGTTDETILESYACYARHLGSAFQIIDDILDVTSTAEELGKTPGKDKEQGKLNHVTAYGMDMALKMAQEESRKAIAAIENLLPENDMLLLLPEYLIYRNH